MRATVANPSSPKKKEEKPSRRKSPTRSPRAKKAATTKAAKTPKTRAKASPSKAVKASTPPKAKATKTMARKKKKGAKRRPKRSRSHHTHATPAATRTTTSRKRRRPRRHNPANPIPSGMVLVRASDLDDHDNPRRRTKRRRHVRRRRHYPHRSNPAVGVLDGAVASDSGGFDGTRGLRAILFGTVAAAAGLAGGAAVAKYVPGNKTAYVAANLAGTLVGGVIGAFNETAGTLIAHNFAVAAGQSFMTTPPGPTELKSLRRGVSVRALRGVDDDEAFQGYEQIQGGEDVYYPQQIQGGEDVYYPQQIQGVVVADNMGDAEDGDVSGYEAIDGVIVADNMGDAEDGDVSGYEAIEGVIVADNMGDAEDGTELGDEWDVDGTDDLFGNVDDDEI